MAPKSPKKRKEPEVSKAAATKDAPPPVPPLTAQSEPLTKRLSSLLWNADFRTAVWLTALAAIYSPVSYLSLSPVYGGVPSYMYHRQGMMACALLAFVARYKLGYRFSRDLTRYIPGFAFWIPVIQYSLIRQSQAFGTYLGPFLTESLTYFPLVALSLYSAAGLLLKVDFSSFGETLGEAGPPVGAYVLFTMLEGFARGFIGLNIGSSLLFSRSGLQILLAASYGLALPSGILWPAIPTLAFTLGFNVHNPMQRTTDLLNTTLGDYNFTLLERKESFTGYLSVLENTHQHYRVMRCDHSLLGGQWTHIREVNGPSVAEPIYAVFAMLEAIRLIEPDDGGARASDTDSNALTIGLGIGTTPGALIMHGISTTIVEIDPVVYDFAMKHFDLPSNHTPIIADAVGYVDWARAAGNVTFDYIVHDVFTGGAEPVALFTLEFMYGLRALLKEDGVIAINYAGDIATPSAQMIVHTIRAVFPTCRIFRENPPPPTKGSQGLDFTNMVIFCKKTRNTPLTFRKPTEADFLQSGARKAFLYPKHEIPEEAFAVKGGPMEMAKLILKKGNTKALEKLQKKSAIGHWYLMRTVLPKEVWENW